MIYYLETQGWQKIVDEEDSSDSEHLTSIEPIVRLGERFRVPLEHAGVDTDRLPEEFS